MQWVDFKHAPMTFYFSADMPYKLLEQKLGVGAKAEFERIGLYTNTRIGAQLAWKRKIGKGTISVGIQPGVFSQTFRGKEVIMPEDEAHQGNDEAIPKQDVSGTVFDANAGVYYTHPKFWVGFSVTHLTSPNIELKVSRESIDYYEFQVSRSYYFMAGGNIPINNTLFDIQPSGMFAATQNFWTAQVAAKVRYNRMLNIGAGYRWKDAVTAFIGVNLKDAYIGYAYDYPVSAVSKATFGSHEVFITYHVKLDPKEKNKNKQKSVRLM
jgi:type IX secretion system PorP/SprF family membrane protein